MALTDILFDQANTNAAARGNGGVVQDNLSNEMTILIRSGVMQRWNTALGVWEVFPLRYLANDGWV